MREDGLMKIGGSLFLIALGAILAFAVRADDLGWISIDAVGWILMIAGVVGLVASLFFWNKERQTTVVARRDDNYPPQV